MTDLLVPSALPHRPRAPLALVTGCAGFLGSHLCEALLADGHRVLGVDCFSDYYPRSLKEANLLDLRSTPGFSLVEADLADAQLDRLVEDANVVFHLAGQPGVRPSFGMGFDTYLRHNVEGTQRLLEAVAGRELAAFVYASSSSVYGDQDTYPAREDAPLRPVSPYGATKVITEQLAGAFWRSRGVPVVGMRYFTVYGPRQRPDMAFSRFISRGLSGRPLTILGDGRQVREFTYVDDVVQATIAAAERGERGSVYNVGGGQAVALLDVVELLAELFGEAPAVEHVEAAPGDPRRTDADIGRAASDLDYRPATPLDVGLAAQIESLATSGAHGDGRPGRWMRVGGGAAREQKVPRLRVLAYSHDGYGLGHLRRNLRLISGLRRRRPDVQATLVTGARSAERLVHGRDIDCVPLPAVIKVANGRYVAEENECAFDDVVEARAELIAATVRDRRPDLLLVDRYPRGMHDELVPALRMQAALRPDAPAVLGLRDILDDQAVIREEWRTGLFTETILETYAEVLCYGDPAVYDPIREYGLSGEVAERVHFTGYLADELLVGDASEVRLRHGADGLRLAVCTLGGGRDAGAIAHAFLSAMELLRKRDWTGVLITGPYMASEDVDRLVRHRAASWISIIPMVDDVPSYLAAADAAVCMGGYNTTCELLALAVSAVIVPRITPRREQLMRAERLGSRGLVRWLHPARMSPGILAEMIEQAGAQSRSELAGTLDAISRRGIHSAAGRLAALLPGARPADVSGRVPVRDDESAERAGAIG